MLKIMRQEFCTLEEVANLLAVTTRTLNRWASDPEGSPEQARELCPKTLINGRRLYPAENVVAIVNRTFGINMTVQDLRDEIDPMPQEHATALSSTHPASAQPDHESPVTSEP